MCLSVPGRIIEINGDKALADIMGACREISLELIRGVKPGEFVLIHAGCAIQKVDEEEARKTIELFNEMKDVMK